MGGISYPVPRVIAGANITLDPVSGILPASIASSGGGGGGGGDGDLVLLDSFIFTGAEATHTFAAISQSYKDLILVFNGRSDRAAQVLSQFGFRFNGDNVAANYYTQLINASNATVNASPNAATLGYINCADLPAANAVADYAAYAEIIIPNYTANAFQKLARGHIMQSNAASAAGHTIREVGGHWLSDVDITSIEIFDANGANFTAGSTIYLYGRGGGNLGVLHVNDTKAVTVAGGTFTSGAWQTRTLNTEISNSITGASLAANQIILPAGTYDVIASAPGFRCNRHQIRLRNITDAVDILLGTNSFADSSVDGDQTNSNIKTRFTITATKTLELQHRCETTVATNGFGVEMTWGDGIFADIFIRKIS